MQQRLRVLLDLLLAFGERVVDVVAAEHLAHRGLGGVAHRVAGIADVEQEVGGPGRPGLDLELHDELQLDDVLVAGEHQRFAIDVVIARRRPDRHGAEAELFLENLRHRRLDHLLERPRQVIAGSGVRLAHHAPEAQHDAALVGRDDVDAAGRVHQQEDRHDQPRTDARRSAVREVAAHLIEDQLDLGQRIVAPPAGRKLVGIGHRRR